MYLSYAASCLSALQRPTWAEHPSFWKVIDTSAWEMTREATIKVATKAYHESMNQFLDQNPMPLQWHALAMAHQRAMSYGERIIEKRLSVHDTGMPKLLQEFRQLCITVMEDSQGVPTAGLYLEYYNINAAALQNYHINSLEEHWQHNFKSRMGDIKEYSQFLLAVDMVRKSYLETCIPCLEALSALENLEDMQQSVSSTFLRMLNNYPEHSPSSRATKTLSMSGSSILHTPLNTNHNHHLRNQHHLHQHTRKDVPSSSTELARARTHHNDTSAIMASINSIEQQIADILQGRQAAEEQAKTYERNSTPTTHVIKPKANTTSRNTAKDHDSKMAVQFGWTLHMLHANTLQYAWIWTWLYSHEGSSRQNVVACDNKMYTATKWIILPAKDQVKTRKDWKVNFGDRVWLVSYWFSTRNAKMMLPEYMPRARGMPCRHLIPYGETYVICKTCPAEILCMRCFRASDHTDHTMYLQCSWGTSVCVCSDPSRLKPGHDLHCSLHCAEEHRSYSSLARGKQCSFKFKAGAKVFRCRHKHFGHDYIALTAEEGAVCCCNDNKSWKPPAAPSCQYHDAGPLDPAYTSEWQLQSQPSSQTQTQLQVQPQKQRRASSGRRCGHVFQPGEDIYHCRDCSLNELTVLCSRCFHGSNCVQHRWRMGEFQGSAQRQPPHQKQHQEQQSPRRRRRRSSSAVSSASSYSRSSCSSSATTITSSAATGVTGKQLPRTTQKKKSIPTITPLDAASRGAGGRRSSAPTSTPIHASNASNGQNKTNQSKGKGKARQLSEDGHDKSRLVTSLVVDISRTSANGHTWKERGVGYSWVESDSDDEEDESNVDQESEEDEEALGASDNDVHGDNQNIGEEDLGEIDEGEVEDEDVDEDDEEDDDEGDDDEDEYDDEDDEVEIPISCDCGDPSMFKSAFDCNYHLPEEYRPTPHLKCCNYQFLVQEIMYHCRTCHVPGSWICSRCYDSVQHAGHPIDTARNEKNEGRYCKCGDQRAMLAKLECRDDHNRQNILCTNDIKEGSYYYSCETCQVDQNSMFCEECFIKTAHEGHKYQALCAPAGFETTRCACGENCAFRYATHCEKHERANGSNVINRCYYVSKAGEWIAVCRDCYPFEDTKDTEDADGYKCQQGASAEMSPASPATQIPKMRYLCIRCRQGSDHTNHRVEWIQLEQDMTYPCACGSELGFEPHARPLCQYHTTLHKTVPSTTLYLHSHSHRSLNHTDHHEVTGYRYHNSDNDWIVCRPEGVGANTASSGGSEGGGGGGGSKNGVSAGNASSSHSTALSGGGGASGSNGNNSPYLQWRDVFWLKHANTGMYLNSMANLKIPQGFQEVTTISGFHSNNDWIIEETTWLRQQILSDE
ncbi:hypothetical protein BGZ73_005071 [Actinomortierella ambigua]|nr:hypothetical protein BGZ73_005071 [Actinomortierella ambigua]